MQHTNDRAIRITSTHDEHWQGEEFMRRYFDQISCYESLLLFH